MSEQDNKNKKIDKLTKKVLQLDDICGSVYVVLIGRKSLRYNELYRSVIKLNSKQSSGKPFVSKPSFDEHLRHLTKQKLVIKKIISKQNVVYSLNKDAMSVFSEDSKDDKDITEWINRLSPFLEPFNAKERYEKLNEKRLKEEVNRDLKEVLKVNLHELRAVVNYNLKIDENESDAEFWRFVGNPLYRILEKSIADKCRDSVRYRMKFFEKLDYWLDHKHDILLRE